jgi:ABC-type spermidine/putrescine transport system permease subunit II
MRVLILGFSGVVLAFLFMPTLVIVPLSFSSDRYFTFPPPGWSLQWYRELLSSQDYPAALWNSVRIGFGSAILATILGTCGAIGVVRGRPPGHNAISIVMIAPFILPQIVLAIGIYPIMVRLGLAGSYPAILIGHTVLCLPLVFICLSAVLASYSPSLELAAMTLGAGWWRTFLHVTLPMITSGLIVGFVFAFTTSFDEIVLAIFLTSNNTMTIPRLLWQQLRFEMTPTVAAATVVIVSLTLSLMFLAILLSRWRGGVRPAGGRFS